MIMPNMQNTSEKAGRCLPALGNDLALFPAIVRSRIGAGRRRLVRRRMDFTPIRCFFVRDPDVVIVGISECLDIGSVRSIPVLVRLTFFAFKASFSSHASPSFKDLAIAYIWWSARQARRFWRWRWARSVHAMMRGRSTRKQANRIRS